MMNHILSVAVHWATTWATATELRVKNIHFDPAEVPLPPSYLIENYVQSSRGAEVPSALPPVELLAKTKDPYFFSERWVLCKPDQRVSPLGFLWDVVFEISGRPAFASINTDRCDSGLIFEVHCSRYIE